jgi:hypothetical protein
MLSKDMKMGLLVKLIRGADDTGIDFFDVGTTFHLDENYDKHTRIFREDPQYIIKPEDVAPVNNIIEMLVGFVKRIQGYIRLNSKRGCS